MFNVLRISAKKLGALALPAFCPRCHWLACRVEHKLPYQIFPSIFASIDGFTKRVVHAHFDRHGRPPAWLAPLGDLVGYRDPPHHSKFKLLDETRNVLLTGSPDAVFVRGDGSCLIADYKTAKFTGTQDALFPLYETQLNVYARIGEAFSFAPVTGLALIYMEPAVGSDSDDAAWAREYGFDMNFRARILDVPLKPDSIEPLVARAREIHDAPQAPASRPGCRDCELVDGLVDAVAAHAS